MIRPRAADDFATIRARLGELSGERVVVTPVEPDGRPDSAQALGDTEGRFKERHKGAPPPWVPAIF